MFDAVPHRHDASPDAVLCVVGAALDAVACRFAECYRLRSEESELCRVRRVPTFPANLTIGRARGEHINRQIG